MAERHLTERIYGRWTNVNGHWAEITFDPKSIESKKKSVMNPLYRKTFGWQAEYGLTRLLK